jgi:hypothetical protein
VTCECSPPHHHWPNCIPHSALSPSSSSHSLHNNPSCGKAALPLHRRGDLTGILPHEPLIMVPPLRCIPPTLVPLRSHSWSHSGLAVVTGSRQGRSWLAHYAQHRRHRHCQWRALSANPRNSQVHHPVQNHVGSTRVASASPAGLPTASFTGVPSSSVSVSLPRGVPTSAASGGQDPVVGQVVQLGRPCSRVEMGLGFIFVLFLFFFTDLMLDSKLHIS